MANEDRVHYAGFSGTITDNPLTLGATTFNSAALANFPALTSGQYAAITLDPLGVAGVPEVVWMTAHSASATVATILRGQETTYGTAAARAHNQGIRWSHAATALDFEYPRNPMSRQYARANYR